ncbi:MAG: hypothetical protein H6799_00990 [Candidatus Nomurabacteria bacterium]|nr:MAG: hypothetical protein H6799_00990 [Candidatus Nomurabacteria bacterium]
MWIGLTAHVIILAIFFKLISDGKNKKKAFNFSAGLIVFVHSLMLISLGLNDSAASLKRVSFEVWVCGKQVELADNSPTGRIFRDGGYFSDKKLNLNSDNDLIRLGTELKAAGLNYSNNSVTLPISNSFELKVSGDSNLEWLNDALKYPTSSKQPSLVINNEKLVCPSGDLGVWNLFLARVDNVKKTYSWQKLSLADLPAVKSRASDGDDLADCLVMDFDISKETPEYRCADILKKDFKRCPEIDKSKCLYKEVRS